MYIFKFADIGEGIHEGKVSDILVKEGDSVKDGTDLFSVETDKITTEVSTPVSGIVSKILIKIGDVIHVGDPIFEIDDSPSGLSSAQSAVVDEIKPNVVETPPIEVPKQVVEEKPSTTGASVVGEVKVSDNVLPLFGSNTLNVSKVESATPVVSNVDVLASPAVRDFAKNHHVDLSKVKASGSMGVITQEDVENYLSASQAPTSVPSNVNESVASITSNANVLASPVARVFAKNHHVDLSKVKASGSMGVITKKDIEDYLSASQAPTSAASESETIKSAATIQVSESVTPTPAVTTVVTQQPVSSATTTLVANKVETKAITKIDEGDKVLEMTSMRKAIANAMKKSWSSAAYTNLSVEIDVTDVWDQRNKIKDYILETENVKLNLLPFIIKAIAKTLKHFPIFNAVNDDANGTLVLRNEINIGIAVDTKDGLIVPNIKGADKLSILEIARAIADIALKARNKNITMADLSKGTFTVSNYGSLGIEFGVPVINYPEVAIAGLGSATNKVKKIGIQMVERKVMFLTIAADHRWVDGGDIARFANQVKQYLENIAFLFV